MAEQTIHESAEASSSLHATNGSNVNNYGNVSHGGIAVIGSQTFTGSTQFGHIYNYGYNLEATEEEKAKACLSALFETLGSNPVDDRADLIRKKGQRVKGTCEWLIVNAIYQEWLDSRSSELLWLSGGPGKGKTMLSIFLTEELERIARPLQKVVVLYCFCDNQDEKRNTAVAVLRSLIFQLLQQIPELSIHVVPSFEIQKKALFKDFEALWRTFENIIEDPVLGVVYCVLDGLDECQAPSLEGLLKKLRTLFSAENVRMSNIGLKLIAVSREIPDFIPRELSGFPHVKLDPDSDAEVKIDLQRFISVKVGELSSERQYSTDLRLLVEKILMKRAEGTFLWIGFVVEELKGKARIEVEEALKNFPPGLDGMYERMLLQIKKDRWETAALILRWVVMAVRPLTLLELSAVTGVKPAIGECIEDATKEQVEFCGHLLALNGDEVNLVHQSAKDYLLRTGPDRYPELGLFHVKEDEANSEIARRCFHYIQHNVLAHGPVGVNKQGQLSDRPYWRAFPLCSYAAIHWPEHARGSSKFLEDLFNLSHPFYQVDSPLRQAWFKTYWAVKEWGRPPTSFSLLHFASYFGFASLAHELLVKGSSSSKSRPCDSLNTLDSRGRTPLSYAAAREHPDAVRLLLEHGADVETHRTGGETALYLAAGNGRETVVRLLLEKGPNIEAMNDLEETALSRAAWSGYTSIVQILLETGADFETRNRAGHTPLYRATSGRHEAVARLLLQKGADASTQERSGRSALYEAARNGSDAIVQLLLDSKTVVATDGMWVPLHAAAGRGHLTLVQLFAVISPEALGTNGQYEGTALHLASMNGHVSVVKLLLEKMSSHSLSILSQNHRGRTPLHCAASHGHMDVVKLLLAQILATDIDLQDNQGCTALHLAAEAGHLDVVELLLIHGSNVKIQDSLGQTVLHRAAAARGTSEIFELLLQYGSDISTPNSSGQTALHELGKCKSLTMVQMLLDRNADYTACDNIGRTPLHSAAQHGHESMVKLLLGFDINVTQCDDDNQTALNLAAENEHQTITRLLMKHFSNSPLHEAVEQGDIAALRMLLDQGNDVSSSGYGGRTPLHLAAERGNLEMVELLLENQASIKHQDPTGQTALHLAAQNGHEDVTLAVLSKGASVDHLDYVKQTPLHQAAQRGHVAVVQTLIKYKANVNDAGSFGRTPLHRAAQEGHAQTIKVLRAAGAKVDAQDGICGEAPLHWAAQEGHTDAVMALLDSGAPVNAVDTTWGSTALHRASQNGQHAMVKYLLSHGA